MLPDQVHHVASRAILLASAIRLHVHSPSLLQCASDILQMYSVGHAAEIECKQLTSGRGTA